MDIDVEDREYCSDSSSLIQCKPCQRVLPRTAFYPSTLKIRLRRCKDCVNEDNRRGRHCRQLMGRKPKVSPRKKLSRWEKMLWRLLRQEAAAPASSSSSPLLQTLRPEDLRQLVEQQFSGRSTLSHLRTQDLVLTRLDPTIPFSRKNIICLTRLEARFHEGALASGQPLSSLYPAGFLQDVRADSSAPAIVIEGRQDDGATVTRLFSRMKEFEVKYQELPAHWRQTLSTLLPGGCTTVGRGTAADTSDV